MDDDAPPPPDSFELIRRHRAGDDEALGRLIQRYYPRIERMVRVRLGAALRSVETVADVVQDVLVRVLKGLDKFEARDDSRWIQWVAQLAQHEILNHARAERAQKRGGGLAHRVRMHAESATNFEIPAESTGVASKAARHEEVDRLDRCMEHLSEPHREVILSREYAGGDWKTVADCMGRTPEACQELHRRARMELARLMRGPL